MNDEGNSTNSHRGEITIDRHYIDSIKTYEITEDQLTIVEAGSSGGTSLNFSVALYSVFLSFLISLLTTKIEDTATLVFFWVVTSVSFILGTFFFINWLKARKSSKAIFIKIREQKSTRAIRDNVKSDNPVTDTSAEQSENDTES